MRLKEVKISIHRKYTENFQSYGYRIGIMFDVDKVDNARTCYYSGKAFLNERIAEEDLIIKNLMAKRVAEKSSGYKELGAIPEGTVSGTDLGGGYKELEKREVGGGDGNVMIPYDVRQIKMVTTGAVLVELFGNKGDLWIPKSCVGDGDAMELMQKGVKTQLFVKNWFLEKSGLM